MVSIIVIQVHAKLHKNLFIYTETLKGVEKFVNNLFNGEKHSFIEWTYML